MNRVLYAFEQRDKCMALARLSESSEQRVFLRFAVSWHRRGMSGLLMQRAIEDCEAAYANERRDVARVAA